MTKTEAFNANFCKMACGSYCKRGGKCNADLFAVKNAAGHLVSEPSDNCRLPPEIIERMKREYGYNPQTKRLTGYVRRTKKRG